MAFVKNKKYLKVCALIWVVCLAAFALSYFLLISPQNIAIKSLENKIVQGEQDYKRAQIAAKYETQDRINQEIESLRNKLDTFVLDNQKAADLTFDISQIANDCLLSSFNVQSNDIEMISESSDPNNIFEKQIKINFIAEFEEFAVFLNTLERHKPVLFVDKFMLSQKNNSEKDYQVTVDLTALVQKQTSVSQQENIEKVVGFNY